MALSGGRGKGLAQLAVQQQLRATYGIKVKSRAAKAGKLLLGSATAAVSESGGKVFGLALPVLPHQIVPECGSIPCFLVEACTYLEEHIHTEGLFRKPGSFVRLKKLKSKLDQGENCLSTAQPCDVAGLLKQFFRELPEPIIPSDLQEALIKAQQLSSEKTSATLLLSCLMNERTIETLRYFFNFLKRVSLRSAENKMDSSNLAVIFSPNLLQSNDADKMSACTERKLRLQAAVIQTFIDHAEDIGHVPKFILAKIPTMLGIDDPDSSPSLQDYDESETPGEHKRSRSLGDVVSGALNKFKSNRTPSTTPQKDRSVFSLVTPMIVTPSVKRKYPADSCQGFSSKKRRSLRHNLALELLPSNLFNISSTPSSAQFEATPCISPEAAQSSPFTSVPSENPLPSIGSRRSKRIARKKVQRIESGKMGCFSPKISRKEMVRRSLRLKFSLGRSSKESTAVEHLASNGSDNIGRRLANQQEKESGVDSVKTFALLSPCVGEFITKEGSKSIIKSKESLVIPNYPNEASYRMSWRGASGTETQAASHCGTSSRACLEAQTFGSEPALTARKLAVSPVQSRPTGASSEQDTRHGSFCEDETHLTTDTLLKIKKAFSESGSNLHNLLEMEPSKTNVAQEMPCVSDMCLERQLLKAKSKKMACVEQKILLGSPANKTNSPDVHRLSKDQINTVEESFPNTTEPVYELSKSYGSVKESWEDESQVTDIITSSDEHSDNTNSCQTAILELNPLFVPENIVEDKEVKYYNPEGHGKEFLESGELHFQSLEDGDRKCKWNLHMETRETAKASPSTKVADHIHWFNNLSLNEPCSANKIKPPLKFQRTPVRQSIRRINSLLEANRQSAHCKPMKVGESCPSLVKSVSYETALSSCAESISSTCIPLMTFSETMNKQKSASDQLAPASKSYPQLMYPSEHVRRSGTTCKEKWTSNNQSKSVLEDLTNHEASKTVVKMSTNVSVDTPEKYVLTKMLTEKKARYRGSPRNPISTVKFLPVIKPFDL